MSLTPPYPTDQHNDASSIPVRIVSGGGGGGGGDASAANQELQLTQETAIATGVGTPADTAAASDTATGSAIAFLKRIAGKIPVVGQALMAASLPVVIASNQSSVPVLPAMASSGNLSAATSATAGATYTAFASQACKQLTIVNDTGASIEVQQGAAGVAIPVFAPGTFTFFGLTNANQLAVRRVDQVATSVTVKARWEA